MSDSWSFEVWQDGACVVSGDAPTEEDARREGMHYAIVYAQDGPVQLRLKPSEADPPTIDSPS